MSGTSQDYSDEQPWWLEDGDHICNSCGHGFHQEALCTCAVCDSHVCCHCSIVFRENRNKPSETLSAVLGRDFQRHCPACSSTEHKRGANP